jgi:low temperature requirement protein LtrA
MAVTLPEAFGAQGLAFAASYVALQLGRSLGMALIFAGEGRARMRNMMRIALWFAASAPLWLAGGMVADANYRLALWLAALAIEYAGPMAMFVVPGLGRSKVTDWDISGSHMAERCALFIIIALGEGIIVAGAIFVSQPPDAGRIGALVIAFVSAVLMWWLYFDIGAPRGTQLIAGNAQPGRLARNAYTYLHMPIVLGIVIGAVGDALLFEHGAGPAGARLVLVVCGGAILYLLGIGLFKRFHNTFRNLPFSHLVGIILFAALGLLGWWLQPSSLAFSGLGCAILALTALWEWVSYNGGWLERIEARGWKLGERFRARAQRRLDRISGD